MNRPYVLSLLAAVAVSGCFKSEIVVPDHATALEQEAAGSFAATDDRLNRAGIEPRPVPLTPDQIATLGLSPPSLVDGLDETSADRLDGLLVQHCVGEGADGLIANTHDACQGAADPDEVQPLIDGVNRARRLLFRFMHDQRPDVSESDLRKAWHAAHMISVVCGGWLESDDGKWGPKKC